MVDIYTTSKTTYLIISNDKLISAFALCKNSISIAVAVVVCTVKHIVMNIISHDACVIEIVVYIQATVEFTILDFHFSGSNFLCGISIFCRRSTDCGACCACKFNIVNCKFAGSRKATDVTAGYISLNVAVSQLCLAAIFVINTDNADACAGNLMVSANRAINIVAIRLERSKACKCTVDVVLNFCNRARNTRILVEGSAIVCNIKIALSPSYAKQSHISLICRLAGIKFFAFIKGFCSHNIFSRNIRTKFKLYSYIACNFCCRCAIFAIFGAIIHICNNAVVGKKLHGHHADNHKHSQKQSKPLKKFVHIFPP